MADYPTQVNVKEAQISKLIDAYKSAYKQIYEEIATSTKFGAANRKAILAQIEGILTDLGEQTQAWIDETIPAQYKVGADTAVSQMKAIDFPVEIKTGFNRVHRDAIAALVDDTSKAFAESLSGVNRSARQLLGKATKELITQQLATGQIAGQATKETQKRIVSILQDEGLAALKDKSGRAWQLDDYTEMLVRTKSVEARNTGLKNRMVENNMDLVQVSSHGATDVCADWEGKILSLTGATPGYPTLADAEADGLFHPNCKHAINGIEMDLARETMAYNSDTGDYEVGVLD